MCHASAVTRGAGVADAGLRCACIVPAASSSAIPPEPLDEPSVDHHDGALVEARADSTRVIKPRTHASPPAAAGVTAGHAGLGALLAAGAPGMAADPPRARAALLAAAEAGNPGGTIALAHASLAAALMLAPSPPRAAALVQAEAAAGDGDATFELAYRHRDSNTSGLPR